MNLIVNTNTITKNDYKMFSKARDAALFSDYKKPHIGCVAVYQNSIIGIGWNSNKTHPMQDYYNKYRFNSNRRYPPPKLHAEISCICSIIHLKINFSKVKLYIYRPRKDIKMGMCRPCPSCMAAIKDLGIKHIYYTTDDGCAYENLGR